MLERAGNAYRRWRLEIAFAIVLYVWLRIARYEFRPTQDGLYVFDRWTAQIARGHAAPQPYR